MLNPTTPPLQKLCAKCHALNIVVSTTNDDVNCNVCHGKTTIKKAGYLHSSIATTRDPIILTIEGKWLKVVVCTSKTLFYSTMSNISLAPYQNQITAQIHFLSYLSIVGFEEYIEEVVL
jgi:hypothetical protein